MMSLTKFQLCLNHENPNIVKTGLIEFSNQVLKDHDAIDSFGYNGRTYSNITQDLLHQVCVFTPVKGILQSYIQSSPRLDDLFILWQLSGRDDDDSLCIAHTRCISVLLFCTGSIPHLQKLIAMKLMNEYVSSIMIQLSKGSIELRKVSVGLLLGILRIKNEEMTNRVLDLILSDPTLFKDQIQSSTASNLKQVQESASTEDFQTSTDIRFMLLILFLTALSSANEAILSLMLAEDSPFLILLEPILSDHASVTHLQLAIEGLMLVSATNKTLQNNLFQVQIMNKISVTKWLELFNHTDHSIRELIGCFIEAVGSSITDLFLSREKSVSTSKGDVNTRKVKPLFAIAKDVSVSLLDLIDPLTFTEHEKIESTLLSSQPWLLTRSLARLNSQWLGVTTDAPGGEETRAKILQCASSLIDSVPLDPTSVTRLQTRQSSNQQQPRQHIGFHKSTDLSGGFDLVWVEDVFRKQIDSHLSALILPGFNRKEFGKFLSSDQKLVGGAMVGYMCSILSRLIRLLSAAELDPSSQHIRMALSSCLQTCFPDMNAFVQYWNRLKSEMADIIGVSQSEHKSTVTKKSKSEKSHLTNDGSIKDRMRLLCVVTSDFLQFLTRYLFLSPSSFTSGFDLLSIFDTVFHLVVLEEHNTEGDINTKSSSLQLRQLTNSIGDDAMDDDSSSVTLLSELALMESCLDLLKEATVAQLCRWIPSQEDTARLFGNVLVSSTWQSFLQKSYLRKLLLLSTQLNKSKHHSPEVSVIESRISSKALDILRTLFDQFELVPVPNQAGYTFRYEFDAWVAAIGHHDDLLCVADLLIRLTATFHQSIQIKSFEMLSRPEMNASGSSEMVSSDSSMTLSPLISCCILLTCGDLEIFSEYLPSSIRAQYLDSDSVDESLVSRYSDGIGGVFQRLLVAVTAATTLFSGGVVDSLTLTSTIVRAISSKPDCNKLLASSPSIDHLSSELKNFLRLSINPQEGSESKDTFNYLENVLENNSVSIVNTWVQDKTKKRKVDDKPKAITMEVADDLSYIGLVSLSKELVIKSFHQLWDLQSLRGNLHLHNHFNSLSITSELHAVLLTVTLAIHRNSLGISRLEFIFSELKELLCHNTDRLHVSILTTLTKLWYVFKSQKFDISASQKPKKRTRTRSGGDLSYDDSTQQSSDTTDTLSGIIQFLETVMLNITDTSDSMEYMYASFQDQHFSDLSLTTDGSSSINSDFCSLFLDRFMKYYTTSTSQTLKSEMKILLVSLSENLVKRSVDGVWTDQMLRIGWQLQEVTQNSHLGKIVIQVLSSRPDSFKALSHQPSNLATNLFASGTPCSYSVNTSSANDIDVLSTAHSTNLSYGIITVGPFTTAILKNCPIENLLRMKAEFDMITADKNNFISSGCCVTVAPTSNDFSASISAWTDISSFLNPFDEYYSTGVNGSYNQSYLMPHQLRVVANHPSDYVAVAEFSTVYKLYQTWRVRISEMTRPTHDLVSTIYKDSPLLQSAFNSLLNSSFVESNLKGLSMALNLLLEQSANKDTMESIFLNMMCPILVKTVHESIVVASRDNQSVTKESNVMTVKSLWVAFYCRFVEHICDLLNSQLLAFYPQSDSLIAPSCDISSINTCYKLWTLTLHTLKDSDTLIVGVFNDNKVQKKLIKAIKTSLKLGIEEPTVLEGLTTVLRQVYDLCLNSNSSNLEGLLSVEISDFYHPAVLFQMTVCHSKFFDSLRNRQSNNSLLLFVLSLLSHVTKTDLDRLGEDCKSFVDTALAMKKYLVSSYRGTMSLTDRISLRILHTLAALNAIEDVYKIQLEVTSSLKQPSEEASAGAARFNLLPCSWLFQAVKQSIMYTTLSDFPTDRCVSPPPMKIESTSASDSYQEKLIETYRSLGRAYSLHPDENMVDEEPVDDSDTDQEDTKMDEDYTVEVNLKLLKQLGVTLSDEQNQAHNAMSVYDPAYWLPVILYRLQVTSNISLRLFCNSGLLALTIAAVGSESLPTRVIALAILHILLCRLNMQTLAHDPSFRARSQIVLLLRFIKNSIERTEQNNVDEDGLQQVQNEINLDSHIVCKVPSFPRSTILFMALSAMHLMQPGHELYGKVNKYLLSRPFCDTKDVPLFDLLVMEGDSTTSVISQQRVEVLRMIRDTLNDRLDHLNLCRKNAYSRLMGMYSIYSQDHKVGNTILDILEKGLSLRDSSRYLVQRCNIASWIHQLGAPNTDENVSSALALDKGNEAEYIVKNKHTGRSKLLHRRMKFMRRLVNACYLLYTEGLISVLEIRHLFTTMTCIVDESLDFYSQHEHTSEQTHFDFEYLSLVVLVMWEMTMLIRCVFIDDAVVKGDLQWKFTYIETFSQILIKMSDDGIDGASELLVTVLLIGSLLGFPDNDTQRRSFMNLSSHALLGRLGIPLHKETTVLGIYPLAQSNIQPSLIVNASDDKSSKVGAVNGYLFLAADVYSSVSDFGKYHSLEAQFSATWREFSVLDLNKCVFQSAGMDTRLLSTLLLSVCLRGITNPSPNTGDGGSVGRDANMSQLRLCLLLYSNFYRQNYLHNSKLMGLGKFRLLSISDSNPLNEYDIDFVKFQLMFRICCLSLLTLLPILPENIALDRVKLCLLKTLTYIMQGNSCSDVSRFISSQQLLQLINVPLTERSFDGLNLWKAMKGGTKMHSDTTMITMYAMQLVSTIVTGLDSTSGLAEICRAEGPTNCVNNLNVLLQGNISNLKKHTNESDEDMDLTSILSSIFT